jgi:hypothetical protein
MILSLLQCRRASRSIGLRLTSAHVTFSVTHMHFLTVLSVVLSKVSDWCIAHGETGVPLIHDGNIPLVVKLCGDWPKPDVRW